MEKVLDAQKRIERKIESLDVSNGVKTYLKTVLQGILNSKNGGLYIKREKNVGEEILTLRRNTDGMYNFCKIIKIFDRDGGSSSITSPILLDLMETVEYVYEHMDIVNSEIVNANNYQKTKTHPIVEQKDEEKLTPEQRKKLEMLKDLSELQGVEDYRKQRVKDLLDALEYRGGTIYTIENENYTEGITLSGDGKTLNYLVVQRMFDYAGSTIDGNSRRVNASALLKYVEEHQVSIDSKIAELKRKHPEFAQMLNPQNLGDMER